LVPVECKKGEMKRIRKLGAVWMTTSVLLAYHFRSKLFPIKTRATHFLVGSVRISIEHYQLEIRLLLAFLYYSKKLRRK
jgi:hypothetical protein